MTKGTAVHLTERRASVTVTTVVAGLIGSSATVHMTGSELGATARGLHAIGEHHLARQLERANAVLLADTDV